MTPVAKRFLTPRELTERYNGAVSVRTLEDMRAAGTGPKFIKLAKKVIYDLHDVEAWEQSRRFSSRAECARDRG